jgi:hypothetical protein
MVRFFIAMVLAGVIVYHVGQVGEQIQAEREASVMRLGTFVDCAASQDRWCGR